MSQRFGVAGEWARRARRRLGQERGLRFLAGRRAPRLAYEPELIPPIEREGVDTLEEWFRWAEEWSMLLRIYGQIRRDSDVLEIGCGLGRVAFPLRYVLSQHGTYHGFEICRDKVEFLQQNFSTAYPNFHFHHEDIHNTFYNPIGMIRPEHYRFPYEDASFDLIYAASVFTHLLPAAAERYMRESSRVLRPQDGASSASSCWTATAPASHVHWALTIRSSKSITPMTIEATTSPFLTPRILRISAHTVSASSSAWQLRRVYDWPSRRFPGSGPEARRPGWDCKTWSC